MATWTDEQNISDRLCNGVGFLILHSPERGKDRYSLSGTPAHTNQSHEPRLFGWCGTNDNVAIHAEGLARVKKVAANGRVLLEAVKATPELLEELGYPEIE